MITGGIGVNRWKHLLFGSDAAGEGNSAGDEAFERRLLDHHRPVYPEESLLYRISVDCAAGSGLGAAHFQVARAAFVALGRSRHHALRWPGRLFVRGVSLLAAAG